MHVGSRALPTLLNATLNAFKVLILFVSEESCFQIQNKMISLFIQFLVEFESATASIYTNALSDSFAYTAECSGNVGKSVDNIH